MSTLKIRIESLTDKLAEAGLAGADMTAELRKLAEAEDLSANEIRRIGESANRRVQLGLFKTASDKRFMFKLADCNTVAGEVSKTAADETEKVSSFDVRLDAINEAGGDPFAAPDRPSYGDLSLFNETVDVKVAETAAKVADAELMAQLRRAQASLEALAHEAKIEESGIKRAAVEANDRLVQSAVNLVTHGITLPSLYDAVLAGASGSNSGVDMADAVGKTDALMELVISGLKARGIENHKMGFRHNGDPNGLAELSTDQLIALCKRHSSYQRPQDLTMADVKTAELLKQADSYLERYSQPGPEGEGAPLRPDDALEMLKRRATQNGQFAVPQAYLDDADNYRNGEPRVYNTNDEFIVSVRDLVGAQDRIRRCHAAQEYIGLKLKKIEDAMAALSEARKTADLASSSDARQLIADVVSMEQEKDAFIGPALGALGALGCGVSGALMNVAKSAPVKAVSNVARQGALAYRKTVPPGARKAIGKTIEVANHPATQIGLLGAGMMKTPSSAEA